MKMINYKVKPIELIPRTQIRIEETFGGKITYYPEKRHMICDLWCPIGVISEGYTNLEDAKLCIDKFLLNQLKETKSIPYPEDQNE